MDRAEAAAFIEYLDSKRSVDDRALNQHVLSALRTALQDGPAKTRLKILEVGAGIGTMITRLLEWQILPSSEYTAVDIDNELVKEGRRRLGRYALKNSLMPGCGLAREIMLQSGGTQISVDFRSADVLDYCQQADSQNSFDLIIAHAFLDLLDLTTAVPLLLATLKPGGLYYFTLVFDGITHFEPPIDRALEDQIQSLYHTSMDERIIAGKPSGDRFSGRHLLGELLKSGTDILAAGPSDWLVYPSSGLYPAMESRFLHHILDAIESELHDRQDLDQGRFRDWLRIRRSQVEAGELIYLAHQVDVLGRRASA
jgi:SAM-dependent methyltransferase